MLNGNVARNKKTILFRDLHHLAFTVAAGIYNTAISISSLAISSDVLMCDRVGSGAWKILLQTSAQQLASWWPADVIITQRTS